MAAPVRSAAPIPARTTWLLFVVFLAGAALMAYEIVGSRLLAPYFGSSTYVWGSLISVFLGALAAGYALGGRLADRVPTAGPLAVILGCSALLVGSSIVLAEPVQDLVTDIDVGARLNPLVASIALFGPASVLMGMVSPFAVRLRANDIGSLGRTAGALYGLSTFGSIAGTLAASFWLVQDFGSEATVITVGCVLAGCALLTAFAGRARITGKLTAAASTVAMLALAVVGAGSDDVGDQVRSVGSGYSPVFRAGGYEAAFTATGSGTLRANTDSSYHRIRVVDYAPGALRAQRLRVLHFDNSLQGAAELRAGKAVVTGPPVHEYLRAFELVTAIEPDAERIALIGLGSGALAMRLHELRPQLQIDVVEIDPKVVDYARRWFGYRDSENGNPRIETHVDDGRAWLTSQDEGSFDAIVLDTYFADSIPFHLTTREFLEVVRERLTDDGVAAANLIGAVEGRRSELLRSMHRTWAAAFDDIALLPIPKSDGSLDLGSFNNVVLFAAPQRGVLPPRGGEVSLVERAAPAAPVIDPFFRTMLASRYTKEISHSGVPLLTDDLAPVDSLLQVDGL